MGGYEEIAIIFRYYANILKFRRFRRPVLISFNPGMQLRLACPALSENLLQQQYLPAHKNDCNKVYHRYGSC